jgi:hypothetical protein
MIKTCIIQRHMEHLTHKTLYYSCLCPVSCVLSATFVFFLCPVSLSCVLCVKCYICLFPVSSVFVLCLLCKVIHVSLDYPCLCHVSCVLSAACVSGLSMSLSCILCVMCYMRLWILHVFTRHRTKTWMIQRHM